MSPLTISDAGSLDAALLMFRQNPQHKQCSFLFVEGESDGKFWQGRIAEKRCCIVFVVAFADNNRKKTGKAAVIENIRSLNASKAKIDGFLGIIDNDFDALAEGLPTEDNICVTDTHDMESLLLRSTDVFRRLLGELGDGKLIAEFEDRQGKPIQTYLLDLALAFA